MDVDVFNMMVDLHAEKTVFDIGVYRRIKTNTHGYRCVLMSTRWRSI